MYSDASYTGKQIIATKSDVHAQDDYTRYFHTTIPIH